MVAFICQWVHPMDASMYSREIFELFTRVRQYVDAGIGSHFFAEIQLHMRWMVSMITSTVQSIFSQLSTYSNQQPKFENSFARVCLGLFAAVLLVSGSVHAESGTRNGKAKSDVQMALTQYEEVFIGRDAGYKNLEPTLRLAALTSVSDWRETLRRIGPPVEAHTRTSLVREKIASWLVMQRDDNWSVGAAFYNEADYANQLAAQPYLVRLSDNYQKNLIAAKFNIRIIYSVPTPVWTLDQKSTQYAAHVEPSSQNPLRGYSVPLSMRKGVQVAVS